MLLDHQVDAGRDIATEFVPLAPPTDKEARKKGGWFAALLLLKADGGFDRVWRAGEADETFLEDVLQHFVMFEERFGLELSSHLTERQAADLSCGSRRITRTAAMKAPNLGTKCPKVP